MNETELDMAERHVREGAHHIKRQREIIEELAERRAPTDEAIRLLRLFEKTQAQHVAHRDRLLKSI